jgi:hypothetical protein
MEKGGSLMLKVIRRRRLRATTATVAVAMLAGLATAGAAFADHDGGREATLKGDWAPMNRCPVDDPAMLAVTGSTGGLLCFADDSPSGSITIGNLTVPIKDSNHQFGITIGETGFNVVESDDALVDEPVEVPGGLRGLVCPSHGHFAWRICRKHHDRWWNGDAGDVTWTMESAGPLTEFNLFAGFVVGAPTARQPVKIHLQNPLLGDNCYIGSEAEPIVLHPASLTPPNGSNEKFDADGTPDEEGGQLEAIIIQNNQGASGFAVPAASGCGFRGFFNQAINSKIGLPSPEGPGNNVVFNEATTYLVGLVNAEGLAPNAGKELSKYWHSAVIPPEGGRHRHGHGWHGGDRRRSGPELEEEGFRHHWFRHGH